MLDGRFRFDNFVVGASNRLALSAAGAVADRPGGVYNPLVVYAGEGLGKTHLLAALGVTIQQSGRGLAVHYVGLASLEEESLEATPAVAVQSLLDEHRECDVLLLDDVQLLSGRRELQSDVLRLLNAMQSAGRQVVMTCDRPPADIADVDPRLLTRVCGGLIVDMGVPEYETRLAILHRKCADRRLALSSEVIEALASMPSRNVRELQSALNRVLAEQIMKAAPLSVEDVQAIMTSRRPERTAPGNEYESFVSEIAAALSQSVEQWRSRLSESIARWAGEGYRVTLLERALEQPTAPDVDALESHFASAVARLRALEAEAVRLDAKFAGLAAFRDPERMSEAEGLVERALVLYDPPAGPDAHFVIEAFLAGARNQLALRAATELIAAPATRHNPFYLFGPPGAGKTHLLHATANALVRQQSGSAVACLDAHRFAAEVTTAGRDGTLDRWRMRYRAADALFIDDLQSLAGRQVQQEELLVLLEALRESGKQVAFAADVAPAHLAGFDPRLRAFFEAGLVVELGPVPESERVARRTPVPDGAEAAAPTIDAWFDEAMEAESPNESAIGVPAGAIDSFFLDPEKVLVDWPGVDGRVLEDLR